MKSHIFIPLLLLVLLLGPISPVSADEESDREWIQNYLATVKIFLLKDDTPYFANMTPELTKAANAWLDAIAARDVEGLLAFIMSEHRDSMRKSFTDPNDKMYRIFFADTSHLYQLAQSKSRDIVLIRKGTRLNSGPGFQVCVFDRERGDPRTDEEYLDIYRNQNIGRICEYFFPVDGYWSFGYTSLDEGGPEAYEPPNGGEQP